MPEEHTGNLSCRCCIVGGGPAGMMLGLLLARAGVDVIVLEKHGDFLRDFRGDTIHPSTLEVMNDLGLYEAVLKLPHQEARHLEAKVGDTTIPLADFAHVPTRAKFIALMPQWDFLNFLAGEGKRYPGFRLVMQGDALDVIEEGGQIAGVRATTPEGPLAIRADLVVAADGRHSTIRQAAGFKPLDIGAPMDVLWFKISRRADDPNETFGRVETGRLLVLINRGEHWQCGYIIPKGGLDAMRRQDVAGFRATLSQMAPFLADRTAEITDWADVKLLTVAVDRLPVWHRPGLLCIGDAAHAMSPVGGVGINLAIQDAVAAANLLVAPLLAQGPIAEAELAKVQARRERAVRLTQAAQVFIQKHVVSNVLAGTKPLRAPWILRAFIHVPALRRIPARLVGIGVRPERVTAPELKPVPAHAT